MGSRDRDVYADTAGGVTIAVWLARAAKASGAVHLTVSVRTSLNRRYLQLTASRANVSVPVTGLDCASKMIAVIGG